VNIPSLTQRPPPPPEESATEQATSTSQNTNPPEQQTDNQDTDGSGFMGTGLSQMQAGGLAGGIGLLAVVAFKFIMCSYRQLF
jgi:hypothetical protein